MINKYMGGRFTEEQALELARNAYRKGDAGFQLNPTSCALLVIDMQDEFVKPHWGPNWVPDATRKVSTIRRIIDHCRNKGIPVIYTVYSKTHNYIDRPKTTYISIGTLAYESLYPMVMVVTILMLQPEGIMGAFDKSRQPGTPITTQLRDYIGRIIDKIRGLR